MLFKRVHANNVQIAVRCATRYNKLCTKDVLHFAKVTENVIIVYIKAQDAQ